MKAKKSSPAKAKPTPLPQAPEPNAAGIDIGATEIWVAVPADCTPEPVRRFGTFSPDLEAIVQHLKACGIRSVVMESTGLYWT